jgi:transcriptional regulator of acetoin/glycerol metabolism
MRPREQRLLSLLVAVNLRVGMPDADAVTHAQRAAEVMMASLGGSSFSIPVANRNSDASIAELRAQGKSVRTIARELHLSRQSVHRAMVRLGLSVPARVSTCDSGQAHPAQGRAA